jgi:peptidoglycan/LPS O-acetylase OafA/YrhL
VIAVDPASTLGARERFPCFDGLRAIAAGAVVLLHVSLISGYTFRQSDGVGPYLARGEAGVYLFFLISGYLLYRPFVAARFDGAPGPGLRSYARRRALRIMPAYWVALTILVVIFDVRERNDVSSLRDVIAYYGFLQIYSESTLIGGLQQAWSLCTEMAFYVFLPLWAMAMRRTRRETESANRALNVELIGLAVLYAVGIVTRWLVVRDFPPGNVAVDYRLDWLPMNADLFALGMGLAVTREWSVRRREPVRVLEIVGRHPGACWALAGVAYWAVSTRAHLTLGVGADTPDQWMARQLLYAATAFFLLLPAVFGPQDHGFVRRLLASRVMVAGGLISYGVYLWHEGVLDVWMRARDIQPFRGAFVPMLAVAVVGTVAIATLSYVLVERPALARSRRASAPRSRGAPGR